MASDLTRLAGFFGLAAVVLGAFGAHGLGPILAEKGTAAIWQTAVFYHLTHAVALFAMSLRHPAPATAAWLWAAGIIIFSGSLYVLALTGIRWLGAITPIGGLCLLGGWIFFLVKPQ